MLNRIGDSGHPCLTPLPIVAGSENSPSILIFTLCPMYRLPINLLCLHSTLFVSVFALISSSPLCQKLFHSRRNRCIYPVHAEYFFLLLLSALLPHLLSLYPS